MPFELNIFSDAQLNDRYLDWLIDDRWPRSQAHFARLWDYYQNPAYPISDVAAKRSDSARTYIAAQEIGLPARITGVTYLPEQGLQAGTLTSDIQRKEVVIENDIAWRIGAMVDFLFGKQPKIISRSPRPARRKAIEAILKAAIDANGGAAFFHDMAVLGSVYGFTDCIVRPGPSTFARLLSRTHGRTESITPDPMSSALRHAAAMDLELIEAPRALPVLDENDCRKMRYYVQHFYQSRNDIDHEQNPVMRLSRDKSYPVCRQTMAVTEILGKNAFQRYERFNLVSESPNPLGFIPVVHIQNLAQPNFYEGVSDVEQLIPLQDELNTRLSDRASRITFQAFRMYLVKGFESDIEMPVGPGRLWRTDNPAASVDTFGGDAASPSENAHIAEIREAMDKISGVTPVVAGVLKNKLGNLTSGVALKMTFMAMLAKTYRKQITYGNGVRRIGQMILEILDKAGVFPTAPEDRVLDVVFPNPLPDDETEKLQQAKLKSELGVPSDKILTELGYEQN